MYAYIYIEREREREGEREAVYFRNFHFKNLSLCGNALHCGQSNTYTTVVKKQLVFFLGGGEGVKVFNQPNATNSRTVHSQLVQ